MSNLCDDLCGEIVKVQEIRVQEEVRPRDEPRLREESQSKEAGTLTEREYLLHETRTPERTEVPGEVFDIG